jgi:hypothetical protein
VFDLPFDSVRQLAGNLTPIHGVLFSKKLVEGGCRFDERLDRLEDWDFWLQVARRADMVHLPGVSAAYRVHESSGVHEDAGPEGAATQRIYEKWIASWSADEGAALMERVWACADLEWDLAATKGRLEDAGRDVARLSESLARLSESVTQLTQITQVHRATAADCERRLADVYTSKSWRVTAPLRWLTGFFKTRK